MPDSVYKVIEIVGTSADSWEKAAETAISRASKSLRDIRIAEVVKQDVQIEDGKIVQYRVRLNISFRFAD
ncbi:MAG: dodecin family protein [Rhodospirillales bacterium]